MSQNKHFTASDNMDWTTLEISGNPNGQIIGRKYNRPVKIKRIRFTGTTGEVGVIKQIDFPSFVLGVDSYDGMVHGTGNYNNIFVPINYANPQAPVISYLTVNPFKLNIQVNNSAWANAELFINAIVEAN